MRLHAVHMHARSVRRTADVWAGLSGVLTSHVLFSSFHIFLAGLEKSGYSVITL